MPARPNIGRSLVTRRAIVDIVRGAVLGSYGVTGVDAGPFERLLGRIGLREPGIRVRLDRGLEIDLHLTVAYGVPVAEVARQVDSAVRYGIRRALERDVRRLAVHVGGLRYQPASVPPTKDGAAPSESGPKHAAPDPPAPSTPSDGAPVAGDVTLAGAGAVPSPATPTGGRRRRRAAGDASLDDAGSAGAGGSDAAVGSNGSRPSDGAERG